MGTGREFQVTPVKLMHTLKGDDTTFLGVECFGDLLPCLAPLALFADEAHERLQAAVKRAPAAGLHSRVVVRIRIHYTPAYRAGARLG